MDAVVCKSCSGRVAAWIAIESEGAKSVLADAATGALSRGFIEVPVPVQCSAVQCTYLSLLGQFSSVVGGVAAVAMNVRKTNNMRDGAGMSNIYSMGKHDSSIDSVKFADSDFPFVLPLLTGAADGSGCGQVRPECARGRTQICLRLALRRHSFGT